MKVENLIRLSTIVLLYIYIYIDVFQFHMKSNLGMEVKWRNFIVAFASSIETLSIFELIALNPSTI